MLRFRILRSYQNYARKSVQYPQLSRNLSTMASSQEFQILRPAPSEDNRQRLGLLRIQSYKAIQTPCLLAIGSRGFVPHLTPDILQNETAIQVIHAGFEDFAESIPQPPSHFEVPCSASESPLRKFTCLPQTSLLVLGPRRAKPVRSIGPNTYTSLNICTSDGHRDLEISYYIEAIKHSRPDVIIAPIDIEFGRQAPGSKRQDKIVERSTAWLRSFETAIKEAISKDRQPPSAWIPLLNLDREVQATYLQHLQEFCSSYIDGIVVYDPANIVCVPSAFESVPLVSLTNPQTPHDVLRLIQLGIDLIAAPFVTEATEAGIALDFSFPAKSDVTSLPLGIDMWSAEFATNVGPLVEDCSCYACLNHHRAYLRHLLSTKEMLAWTLLQIHNHHIMNTFFEGIRRSIAHRTFETSAEQFALVYASELPTFQGQGPRLRGYQASLGLSPAKLNKSPYKKMSKESSSQTASTEGILDDRQEKRLESQEASVLSPGVDAVNLEDLGFAQLYDKDEGRDAEN